MRKLVSVALLLATLVVGSGAVRPATAHAQATCGVVLLRGSQWLQGAGVDVHSNGPGQFTGQSCGGVSTVTPAAQYGYGWQCVELAARLYQVRGWGRVYANGGPTAGDYRYGAQYIPEGSPSLIFHSVTTNYVPVPGDLVIEAGATYGHVSIVDHVEPASNGQTRIIAVEQNASLTGWHIYQRSNGAMTGGYHPLKGFLHSPKNTHVDHGGTRRGYVALGITSTGSLMRDGTFISLPLNLAVHRGTSPSIVPTSKGSYAAAYVDVDGYVYFVDGQGRRLSTGLKPALGTSASLALDPDNNPWIAIQNSQHALVVWSSGGAQTLPSTLAPTATPSLVFTLSGSYFVAFPDNTGHVRVETSQATYDTGLVARSGTNASLAVLIQAQQLVVASVDVAGKVQVASSPGGSSPYAFSTAAPLGISVLAGTSPSIVSVGTSGYQVAAVTTQQQVRSMGTLGPMSSVLGTLRATSSPSLSVRDDGMIDVAVRGSDGFLWVITKGGTTRRPLQLATGVNPVITLLH